MFCFKCTSEVTHKFCLPGTWKLSSSIGTILPESSFNFISANGPQHNQPNASWNLRKQGSTDLECLFHWLWRNTGFLIFIFWGKNAAEGCRLSFFSLDLSSDIFIASNTSSFVHTFRASEPIPTPLNTPSYQEDDSHFYLAFDGSLKSLSFTSAFSFFLCCFSSLAGVY